jgi:4-diphosphocytidyl-2-C-methyl-D-erythritol kinase
MIAFPNAKINLGLRVLDKRTDGYHNIETVFLPVDFCDVLEILPAGNGIFSFQTTGMPIPGNPDDNLCVKAYRLMASEFDIPPVKIHLHKVIPMGGGIGGGSSDGAFTIKLLNELFSLGISAEKMESFALKLGSDSPFFIQNKPAIGSGRGEKLSFIPLDLSGYCIVVVLPAIHVGTGEAYEWIDSHASKPELTGRHHPFCKVPDLAVDRWKDELFNDFEPPVFSRHPEIKKCKELLYENGAVYASMTGSGAAVYGLFREEVKDLQRPGEFSVYKTKPLIL